jgi:hypothetical protein
MATGQSVRLITEGATGGRPSSQADQLAQLLGSLDLHRLHPCARLVGAAPAWRSFDPMHAKGAKPPAEAVSVDQAHLGLVSPSLRQR